MAEEVVCPDCGRALPVEAFMWGLATRPRKRCLDCEKERIRECNRRRRHGGSDASRERKRARALANGSKGFTTRPDATGDPLGPHKALAAQVCIQAAQEYTAELKRLTHADLPPVSRKTRELEAFFRSEWGALLLQGVSGEQVIAECRRRAAYGRG